MHPVFLTWLIIWLLGTGTPALALPADVPVGNAAPESTVAISASCRVRGNGTLYVFLTDESRFAAPMTGLCSRSLAVTATPASPVTVRFGFRVPPGRYGLRCFLDINGNGILDRGPFGPAEPWGMSWRAARPVGFPVFRDIAFNAQGDCQCPAIEIE